MILLLCGLSGAGKTTLSTAVYASLLNDGLPCEILDGDECRTHLFKELGFSPEDREENMLRLAYIAHKLSGNGIITIISAINPFEHIRQQIKDTFPDVMIVHIDCTLDTLQKRDTKGLYALSLLPDGHPDKVYQMTGISQQFDIPQNPDLIINTALDSLENCVNQLTAFIYNQISNE